MRFTVSSLCRQSTIIVPCHGERGVATCSDNVLLTIDEQATMSEAREVAKKIDQFLIARESNVLNKLIAIGGVAQTESLKSGPEARLDDLTTD